MSKCRVCREVIFKGTGIFYKGMHIHKVCKTTAEIYWWRYKRLISKDASQRLIPVGVEFNEFLNYLMEHNLSYIRNNPRIRKKLNMNVNRITKFIQTLVHLKIITLYNDSGAALYKINRVETIVPRILETLRLR